MKRETLTGRDLLELIAEAQRRRSVTPSEIARRVRLPEGTVARMLAPDRPVPAQEAESIFGALGLSREAPPAGASEDLPPDPAPVGRLAALEQSVRLLEERLAKLEGKEGPDS